MDELLFSADYQIINTQLLPAPETFSFTNTFDPNISEIDKWDYTVAAASGVLTAALDILWVKDFSLEEAHTWGNDKVETFVKEIAKKKGYKGNSIDGAIRKLEGIYTIPGDELTNNFGGGRQHHLRDFSHHPTLLGLCCSILTQFTGYGYGTDTNGKFVQYKVPTKDNIGKDITEKIFKGTVIWIYHLISDMAGSSGFTGEGTGIPGPIVSALKELSTLPIIKDIKVKYKDDDIAISKAISKVFNGTAFAEGKDAVIFDLRTEMGILKHLTKQALPVIANECIIRGFYFVRRVYLEIKEKDICSITDLKRIDRQRILPANNRTMTRMITVSSGTFMSIVTAEVAIKSAIKAKGVKEVFLPMFLVNINWFGVGRFVFACVADAKYIAEDMQAACKEFAEKQAKEAFERTQNIKGINLLSLSNEQSRILYSLEWQKTSYDINTSRTSKTKDNKTVWLEEWEQSFAKDFLIKDEETLYKRIGTETGNSIDWLYVATLELMNFKPYALLGSKNDVDYKKLKMHANYEENVFCEMQDIISHKEYQHIKKTLEQYEGKLNNTTTKVAIGTAVTVVTTALTGGLALTFAPGIAVTLAGGTFAGLSGAALTSASLAFIGGGSLAAGGLGMAGGTAIIAGGGALLGMVGSGASISTAMVLSNKTLVLNECAKLLTFCKTVLEKKNGDIETIKSYQAEIEKLAQDTAEELETLKSQKPTDKKVLKELKQTIENSTDSLKYLNRCQEQLTKMLK